MAKLPEFFHFQVRGDLAKIEIQDVSDKDFVEVVRCRECKHNKGAKVWRFLDLEDTTADCSEGHGYPPMDWFCADGEKREES